MTYVINSVDKIGTHKRAIRREKMLNFFKDFLIGAFIMFLVFLFFAIHILVYGTI